MSEKTSVLISLRKKWWDKILSGEKVFELRKSAPRSQDGKKFAWPLKGKKFAWPLEVLVYVSGTGEVQGKFVCPGFVEAEVCRDPLRIYNLAENACLSPEELVAYANGGRLFVWYVQEPEEFKNPIPLAQLGIKRPPQSWMYIEMPSGKEVPGETAD